MSCRFDVLLTSVQANRLHQLEVVTIVATEPAL